MPPKPRKPPPRQQGTRTRDILIAVAGAVVVVAMLVGASLLFRGGDDEETPSTPAPPSRLLDGIPQESDVLGAPSATVTLVQFEDLQCPICRSYQESAFPGIVREYVRPGKVKVRFAGLAFIGPDSEKALQYVLAAGAQGKLWQLSEALYANQGDENSGWVTDELLQRLAGELGLDWTRLQTDAAGDDVQSQARAMAAEGARLEVPGTPTFFVQIGDGQPYQVQPASFAPDAFRPILDDALAD